MAMTDSSGNERKGIEVFGFMAEVWYVPSFSCEGIADAWSKGFVNTPSITYDTIRDLMLAGF